ncbi:MAG TPA: class F sortase [Acidimicrobiales bacterium]|nr:class F sortase [Acidimicrobiales bacterium]
MAGTARPAAPAGPAAWWRRAARRPAVLWTVALLDAAVLLDGAAAAAWSALRVPAPVQVGRLNDMGVRAPAAAPATQPAPVAVDIPRIGVHTALVGLDVDPTGLLEAPRDFSVAGWWRAGPAPGDEGAAVVVGHLDSHTGPAAFFKVPTLQPGDRIAIRRADGSTTSFAVDAVRQYPKDDLPAARVYGPTAGPELRLITCGGAFDRRARSYKDNIVVFAHQAPYPPQKDGPA